MAKLFASSFLIWTIDLSDCLTNGCTKIKKKVVSLERLEESNTGMMEKGAVSVIICAHLENLLIGPYMHYPSQKMAEMQ